jgi:hypothetical protein
MAKPKGGIENSMLEEKCSLAGCAPTPEALVTQIHRIAYLPARK